MSSWDQANRGEKLGLIWRNRKKICQIINDYLYFLFFLLIILCFYIATNFLSLSLFKNLFEQLFLYSGNLTVYEEIHLVPCLNPDGYTSGSRHNANDEDLNRGFPGWKDVGKSRLFLKILLKSSYKIFNLLISGYL
jgi:hypothetical protein